MRRSDRLTRIRNWFLAAGDPAQRVARMSSGFVVLVSSLVLLGWALNIPALKTMLILGGGNMRANAALGLLLSGVALGLLTRKQLSSRTVRVVQACTIGAGALGLLTLLQYAFGWDLGIDQLLFRDPAPNPPTLLPGRMSMSAAINLSLISAALGLLSASATASHHPSSSRPSRLNRTSIAQSLVLLVGVIALQAFLARIYGLPSLSWLGSIAFTMGGHTALAFGALAAGILALRSESGWMPILLGESIGSLVARRFAPVLVVTPLILGWLILQGHQANWYDAYFAISLMSVVFAVTTVGVLIRGAGRLNRVDAARQQSSDRLRSSEARLRLAQTVTDTGTWEWNVQTGELLWSDPCYALLGVSPTETDLLGAFMARVAPEDLPQIEAVVQNPTSITTIELEYRYHHPERGLRWIYSRAAAVADDPAVVRGISFDISDRKQAELDRALDQETIQRQLAEIEAIYHTAPAGLAIFDRDLRYLRLNQRLAELNGVPVEAHLGRTIREIIPAVAAEIEPIFRRVMETGEPLLGLEITGETAAQPGVQRTWLENLYPLRDASGQTIGLNVVVQEITQRKQMELALRDQEQQLQQLSDSMPQFVWTCNAQGALEYVNRQWCDYAGLTLEQCRRDPAILAAYHHPEEVEQAFAQWRTALETQQPFEFEGRLRSHTETYRWFLMRAVPILDEQGQVLRWYGTSTDIHDRKLNQLNDQFLNELDAQLRQLTDPEAMKWEIVSRLGQYLNLDRALWNEIDWENGLIRIDRDWRRADLPSHAGTYPLANFIPPELQAAHAAGQPLIVSDVTTDPQTAAYADTYQQLNIGALISYPCIYQGRWVVVLSVNTITARQWQASEITLIQDITTRLWSLIEQTRAVQALRQSEDRFRTLADNISQLVWTTDASGWINWYNQRWFDYTGTTLEEMQGWGWQKVHHPDHVDRVVAHIRHCFETGETWEDTFPLRGRDGQYRWFLSRAIPIRDAQGNILRWFGTNTDITDRKQAEADLEERNQHIQLLYETTRDLLLTDQPLALIETVFAKLQPLMGLDNYSSYLLDEDQQQLHLEYYGGISEDMARSLEWLEMGQAVCGTVAQQQRQMVQSDIQYSTDPFAELLRRLKLTAYACQPLIAQGHLFGTLSFGSRSRTSFTASEIRLFQAISDQIAIALERAKLVSSLQQRTEELTRLNRLKDEFLAALSHELRTPLSPILGWTQMLKAQKLTPAKTTEALEIIERNIKHQIALVNDLLDVSRVIQGKLNLTLNPTDLVTVVQRAIETVQFTAQAKQIQIQMQGEPALPILGDDDRLQQIFWNLLSNAAKFTPERGTIAVHLSSVTRDNSNYAQVQVIDNGIGIQADFLPYVFEHFRQADGSDTRKYGGLGLGLAIVRHLVELHGGTVAVESSGTGQGSTFTVRLPLHQVSAASTPNTPQEARAIARELQPPQNPPAAIPPVTDSSLSGLRILLVDDDRDNLDLLCFLLQEHGAIITLFTSAIDALDFVSTHPLDVIVSDIGMPQMSGYDFIQQVRALPTGRQIPALALTAFGQPKDQAIALESGFNTHITKPVDPLELLSTLKQLVQANTVL